MVYITHRRISVLLSAALFACVGSLAISAESPDASVGERSSAAAIPAARKNGGASSDTGEQRTQKKMPPVELPEYSERISSENAAVSSRKTMPADDAASKTVPAEKAACADPFAYQVPADNESGFVSSARARIPNGIRIVAILQVEGKSPMAVLDIPHCSCGDLHYVRENDVIQLDGSTNDSATSTQKPPAARRTVPTKQLTSPSTAQQTQAQQPVSSEPEGYYYLVIGKISANEVEIAPKMRPQEAIILR